MKGFKEPGSRVGNALFAILVLAMLTPWILMALGTCVVGLSALGPRRDEFRGLWFCLPGGLFMLSLIGYFQYWAFWHHPGQQVKRFEFDGEMLTLVTRKYGEVCRPAKDLRSVVDQRSRNWNGWWLKFEGLGWLFLTRDTLNAEELVRYLRAIGNGDGD
jgi:hypothetical protein